MTACATTTSLACARTRCLPTRCGQKDTRELAERRTDTERERLKEDWEQFGYWVERRATTFSLIGTVCSSCPHSPPSHSPLQKADLGTCPKAHNEAMREKYEEEVEAGKRFGFEEEVRTGRRFWKALCVATLTERTENF